MEKQKIMRWYQRIFYYVSNASKFAHSSKSGISIKRLSYFWFLEGVIWPKALRGDFHNLVINTRLVKKDPLWFVQVVCMLQQKLSFFFFFFLVTLQSIYAFIWQTGTHTLYTTCVCVCCFVPFAIKREMYKDFDRKEDIPTVFWPNRKSRMADFLSRECMMWLCPWNGMMHQLGLGERSFKGVQVSQPHDQIWLATHRWLSCSLLCSRALKSIWATEKS